MFTVLKLKPPIVIEAQKAKFKPSFIIQLLIFVGIYIVISIVQAIPFTVYGMYLGVRAVMSNQIQANDPVAMQDLIEQANNDLALPLLFSTVIITVIAILYCRFIEKRSMYSMGFTTKRAFYDYGIGLLVGLGLFSISVLISWISGTIHYNGYTLGNGIGLLIAFFLGFIIQGMSEEVLLRGYLMVSIASKNSVILAIMANSILFALLHIFNNGITLLAIINLTLFGVFASVYMLKTNNIWGVCAIHTMWNFAQGNIFGISVSGMEMKASVFSFVPSNEGTLINGGTFGLEGGLAVTIVLTIAIIAIVLIKGKPVATDIHVDNDIEIQDIPAL